MKKKTLFCFFVIAIVMSLNFTISLSEKDDLIEENKNLFLELVDKISFAITGRTIFYPYMDFLVLDFNGGEGTIDNPYEVSTCQQLQDMRDCLSCHYILVDDIDCSMTKNWNCETGICLGFEPIGNNTERFIGKFNGAHRTISGLYINRTSESNVGLFGILGSESKLENIFLSEIKINGANSVGGIAGRNILGTISNSGVVSGSILGNRNVGAISGDIINGGSIFRSFNEALVSGRNYVGGIIGENHNGIITESYNSGRVTGVEYVGGIAGTSYMPLAVILDSSNYGEITGVNRVGGISGHNWGGIVSRTYSVGKVFGDEYVGGIVGTPLGQSDNSFWLSGTLSNSNSIGVEKNESDMKNISAFLGTGWDIFSSTNYYNETWIIYENEYPRLGWSLFLFDGGRGEEEDPYLISNCYQLQRIKDCLDCNYSLIGDIDCHSTSFWNCEGGACFGFEPIGNFSEKFIGRLDGRNNLINGLYINRTLEDHIGLFGATDYGATVRNLGLIGNISGKNYVGGVVGYNLGNLSNIHNLGKVGSFANSQIRSLGGEYVGGLAGYNQGVIKNSDNLGEIYSPLGYVGGISGNNAGVIMKTNNRGSVKSGSTILGGISGGNLGNISKSYNVGVVSGRNSVGGITADNNGIISRSYNFGIVSGNFYVGGLCARNLGNILMSYNFGNITASNNHYGGISGSNSGRIFQTYNVGFISGGLFGGALVGTNSGEVIDSFFLNGSGPDSGLGLGVNESIMKTRDTYTSKGWQIIEPFEDDSFDYWIMDEGNYPRIRLRYLDVKINSPKNQNYSGLYQTLDISVEEDLLIDSIWYNFGIENLTYVTSSLVEFKEGFNTLNVWANNSLSEIVFESVSFNVSKIPSQEKTNPSRDYGGSGGGGSTGPIGGGSGGIEGTSCIPNWTCSFGECLHGARRQICIDLDNCGSSLNKPAERIEFCSELDEIILDEQHKTSLSDMILEDSSKNLVRKIVLTVLLFLIILGIICAVIISLIIYRKSRLKSIPKKNILKVSSPTEDLLNGSLKKKIQGRSIIEPEDIKPKKSLEKEDSKRLKGHLNNGSIEKTSKRESQLGALDLDSDKKIKDLLIEGKRFVRLKNKKEASRVYSEVKKIYDSEELKEDYYKEIIKFYESINKI